ncbi:MAG: hypothetical protein ACRD2Q_08340 [Terriglobales bacterium]
MKLSASAPHVIVLASNAVCGVSNFLLGGAHLQGVLRHALEGKGFGGAPVFQYGFPFYSVVLLGVMIAGPGFACLWHARRLWRGEGAARIVAMRWSTLLLLINAPLIPLQDFAMMLTATSAVNVIVLLATRKAFSR